MSDSNRSSREPARVIARHRRHAIIDAGDGTTVSCHSASRNLRPLVGDLVRWKRESPERGVITAIEPRDTLLTRVNKRGLAQPVAANLTQLVVVVAAEPAIDWLVLDHYLAAAQLAGLKPLIVFNKTDLAPGVPKELLAYEKFAPVFATTTLGGHIETDVYEQLKDERSALVGQSGVGKSSLLNALLGHATQAVGALSDKLRQGRHTTTATALYTLENGAEVVDSPGVRQYAPYIEHERDVAAGFREFEPFIEHCRFADCKHLNEPDCAVRAAVDRGDVTQRRYDNYCNLFELTAELRARREP